MATVTEKKLVTTNEAAKMLGVTPARVYQLAVDGRIKRRKVGARKLIDVRSIEKHAGKKLTKTVAPRPSAKTDPKASWRTITPALAQKWLDENANTANRNIAKHSLTSYEQDMQAGNWLPTGDPIRFDDAGMLIDGHHRLTACVNSGQEFRSLVVTDVPREAIHALDIGRRRTLGDHLKMDGLKRNGAAVASTISTVLRYRSASINKTYFNHLDALAFYEENNALVEAAAAVASKYSNDGPRIPFATIGFIYIETAENKSLVEDFFSRVASGSMLEKGTPEYALHRWWMAERMSRTKTSRFDRLAITVKAWNAFVSNETVGILRLGKDEAFPTVL